MKTCTHCFFRVSICLRFGVAAGSNLEHLDCLIKGTHTCFSTLSNGHILSSPLMDKSISSHRLSESQSYKIIKRTYLTHFVCGVCTESIHTVSQKYKATEPWVSVMCFYHLDLLVCCISFSSSCLYMQDHYYLSSSRTSSSLPL